MAWISSHANYTDFNALPMLKSDMVNMETDMVSIFTSSYTNSSMTRIYCLLQNVLFLKEKKKFVALNDSLHVRIRGQQLH